MKMALCIGIAAGLVVIPSVGCGEHEPSHPIARPPAEAGQESSGPNRVTLTSEAAREARIATEVIHPAPFAVTLVLQARLSPLSETPEELEARLVYQSADARFRRASAEMQRVQKLAADNVIASKAIQATEAELAQAKVERLRSDAALRNLGIDASREGDSPSADFWALADVYEPQAPQVTPGARCWIRVESFPGESFPARVVSLARFLKPQTRTLTARIAIQDPQHRLRPQGLAAAEIQIAEHTALSVPTSCLLYEGTDRVLFVKHGDGFEKIRVRVGAEQAGRAEILEGVSDGDEVVNSGAQILLGELFKTRIQGSEEGD